MKSILMGCALLMLGACVVPVPVAVPVGVPTRAATPVVPLAPATAPQSSTFDRLINDYRAQAGLPALRSLRGLDRVAAAHAADMRAGGYIAHRDRMGRKASARVRAAGVSRCPAGENLARGQGSAAQVFRDWTTSPGHRRNMLTRGYTHYGFARQGDYWVLVLLMRC